MQTVDAMQKRSAPPRLTHTDNELGARADLIHLITESLPAGKPRTPAERHHKLVEDTGRAAVAGWISHPAVGREVKGAGPTLDAEANLLGFGRWIVATHQATFTQREAFRALRGQTMFATVERLAAGLAVLGAHGWVRQLAPERGPGRPPSRYETNPAIFLDAWTKRPELAKSTEQDDVLSILSLDSAERNAAAPGPDSALSPDPPIAPP